MNPGDMIDLDITAVAHGGVFIGRHEGRVVFVSDAIPGERVRVRLTATGDRSFWRGDTVEVLDASPHRRAHIWPAADVGIDPDRRAGGADFGHIALAHQRELKLEVLRDALERFAGITPEIGMRQPAGADDGTHWRTRVSLHVDDDGRVGPFASRSHRVIETETLPLAVPEIEAAMLDLASGAGGQAAPGRIDLVRPADGRVRILPRPQRDRAGRGRPGRDRHGARSRQRENRQRESRQRQDHRPTAATPPPARERIIERVGTREFALDAGGFWQVHHDAAVTLSRLVSDAAIAAGGVDPAALHLDLYGGVGLFAAALATSAGGEVGVISVEADARATEHAGANLSDWVGVRAETGRIDRWLPAWAERAGARDRQRLREGVVVLDPPRTGAGAAVSEQIAALQPTTVVYVACDPVALARDLNTFREAGYEASEVTAVDLFPHAHHLETVATLRRVDGALAVLPIDVVDAVDG